jgi:hypothetical protein
LDLEGVDAHPLVTALRNAHERQKKDTATAKARVAELEAKVTDLPDGFSADEWERLKGVDEEYKKNPGNPDNKKIHEAEVQSVKAMYEQKLANAAKKAEADLAAERAAHSKSKSILRGRVVGDDLTKALIEAGVDKRYLAASKALLEKSVKVIEDDEGTMTAVFETDLGEQTIDQFVPQWAQADTGKHFLTPASGSGSHGSDGVKNASGMGGANPFSKVGWNMTQQGKMYAADQAKADRMAKLAGHAQALGAKLANAK